MIQSVSRSIATIFFSAVISVAIIGCNSGLGSVYSPQEWRDVLKKAGGWVPLVIPDSKYRPGSIITVSVTDGQPRWIDHLDGCVKDDDFKAFLEVGAIPSIQFSKDASFDANLLLNYRGITAGPAFNRVKKVRLSVDDHSAIAMRLITFRSWYENLEDEDYIRKIDPCLDALEAPNTFLVTEAFVVNEATYKLYTETGAEIELKTPELGEIFKFDTNLKYAVSTDGGLTVNESAVFAVRQAMRVGSGFQVLATPTDAEKSSADALLDKWYVRSME